MSGHEVRVQYELEMPEHDTVPATVTLRRKALVHCREGWKERFVESTYKLVTGSTSMSEQKSEAPWPEVTKLPD